jgi:hypothetical protein
LGLYCNLGNALGSVLSWYLIFIINKQKITI